MHTMCLFRARLIRCEKLSQPPGDFLSKSLLVTESLCTESAEILAMTESLALTVHSFALARWNNKKFTAREFRFSGEQQALNPTVSTNPMPT